MVLGGSLDLVYVVGLGLQGVLVFSSKMTVELSFVVWVIVRALMMAHGTIYQFGMGFIHGGGK